MILYPRMGCVSIRMWVICVEKKAARRRLFPLAQSERKGCYLCEEYQPRALTNKATMPTQMRAAGIMAKVSLTRKTTMEENDM